MAFPQHISFPAPNAFHRHSLIKPHKTFGRKGSKALLICYLYCCSAWRPQPGPRGPVILDLTYTEEEMSARRGAARARGHAGEAADEHRCRQSAAFQHRALPAAGVAPTPVLPAPHQLHCAFYWCSEAPAPPYQRLALILLPQTPALLHLIPSAFSWGCFGLAARPALKKV